MLGVGMAVLLFAAGIACGGAATAARHEAQRAADLSALAGARFAVDGATVACAHAAEIASRNGTRIVACALDGLDLTVTVARPVILLGREAIASARAGPIRALVDD
jgi:secretion/DNA translocation related TadE-like protein